MKQEPIAWLSERLNDGSKRLSFYEPPNTDGNPDYKVEPLYTSPQYRELSDDEMTALLEARSIAMKFTVEARVPECGEFGRIAQDLDFAISSILERAKHES